MRAVTMIGRSLLVASVLCLGLVSPLRAQNEKQTESPGGEAAQEAGEAQGANARQELPDVDTSQWACELCPFDSGWSGTVEVGAGYVSEDSFQFGDFRGLEDEGGFFIGGGRARYRGEDAAYAELTADELGLGTRSIEAEWGRQGRYRIWMGYDELGHFIADETETVFSGVGTSRLTLPDDWVRGATTADMPRLGETLHGVDIERERRSGAVGLELGGEDPWRYELSYRTDTQEGNRIQGGSVLLISSLLPVPVDYRTDRIDASVGYVQERWQLELAYYGSFFYNDHEQVTWDNPFTALEPGADRGRLALPPDNRFNQVSVSGSWRPTNMVSLIGQLAYGRMEQDADYLSPTINTSIATPGLPRDSLGGQVDTKNADVRVTVRPLNALDVQGELYYDERDNDTPRDVYRQVPTDLFVGGTRVNRPYSYEKTGGEVSADYRMSSRVAFSAGAATEQKERSLQEVEETDTDRYWAEIRGSLTERAGLRLRRAREQRQRSGPYQPLDLDRPENPRLRKFHLGDRDRTTTRVVFDYTPEDWISFAVSADFAEDDYKGTSIGLTAARDASYSFDVSMTPTERITAYGFVSVQSIESQLQGADSVDGALWVAEQDDHFESIGFGLEWHEFPVAFDKVGADVSYTQGKSTIDVTKRGSHAPFPALDTRLYSLEAFAERSIRENTDLRIGYLMMDYSEDDFFVDDVAPDTISNVLTLGQGSPGYTAHVIRFSFRHHF